MTMADFRVEQLIEGDHGYIVIDGNHGGDQVAPGEDDWPRYTWEEANRLVAEMNAKPEPYSYNPQHQVTEAEIEKFLAEWKQGRTKRQGRM